MALVTEQMEVINAGMFQCEKLLQRIKFLSAGLKVRTKRAGQEVVALIDAHKETAQEVARLINN
jgi:hypothetical protein